MTDRASLLNYVKGLKQWDEGSGNLIRVSGPQYCCGVCIEKGLQRGHSSCNELSDGEFLSAVKEGIVTQSYDDGYHGWRVVDSGAVNLKGFN